MSDQFKAIVLNQEGENFSREVKSLDRSFLKHGDVTVKVDYSDLNFKAVSYTHLRAHET